jgi:hypothetical protein
VTGPVLSLLPGLGVVWDIDMRHDLVACSIPQRNKGHGPDAYYSSAIDRQAQSQKSNEITELGGWWPSHDLTMYGVQTKRLGGSPQLATNLALAPARWPA